MRNFIVIVTVFICSLVDIIAFSVVRTVSFQSQLYSEDVKKETDEIKHEDKILHRSKKWDGTRPPITNMLRLGIIETPCFSCDSEYSL
jgi:hypothetical protein